MTDALTPAPSAPAAQESAPESAPIALGSPLTLRGVTLRNRIGVSPMCMYASTDGFATDFHLVHLGRFALGGAALVLTEATAIVPEGRISHRDLGIWSDEHVEGLRRVAHFVSAHGAVPGIQLAHAGRRASVTEPWRGGRPLGLGETGAGDADAGEPPWPVVGPSAVAAGPGWPTPHAMSRPEIAASVATWAAAARRAVAAGFRVIELHGAHGYLLHSFLSPLSNQRDDEFGGSPEGRLRYPVEVISAIRAAIPDELPILFRLSAVDAAVGGITIDDSAAIASALARAGADLIDTSSGGISTDRAVDLRVRRGFAFHADFSTRIRQEAAVAVATVGLVVDPWQAELLVRSGAADLVLLGRAMLDDPEWAHHALRQLQGGPHAGDIRFAHALDLHRRALDQLTAAGETPLSRFTSPATE
jgi:2,4-dienoyl-CoA reductase-like NADH-dependent reductase (Old Yellow Enzyme family)